MVKDEAIQMNIIINKLNKWRLILIKSLIEPSNYFSSLITALGDLSFGSAKLEFSSLEVSTAESTLAFNYPFPINVFLVMTSLSNYSVNSTSCLLNLAIQLITLRASSKFFLQMRNLGLSGNM